MLKFVISLASWKLSTARRLEGVQKLRVFGKSPDPGCSHRHCFSKYQEFGGQYVFASQKTTRGSSPWCSCRMSKTWPSCWAWTNSNLPLKSSAMARDSITALCWPLKSFAVKCRLCIEVAFLGSFEYLGGSYLEQASLRCLPALLGVLPSLQKLLKAFSSSRKAVQASSRSCTDSPYSIPAYKHQVQEYCPSCEHTSRNGSSKSSESSSS